MPAYPIQFKLKIIKKALEELKICYWSRLCFVSTKGWIKYMFGTHKHTVGEGCRGENS